MFELLKEMEKMKNGGCTPAQVAQPAQAPASRGLQLTQPLRKLRKSTEEKQLTQSYAAAAQAAGPAVTGLTQLTQLTQGCGAEIIKWPHPGKPLSRRQVWGFLVPCPFTRTMLEKATELWKEPLDANDWVDVLAGKYLFENKEVALRDYLCQWADDNPEKMRQLVEVLV